MGTGGRGTLKVVIDTNDLVSAIIAPTSTPASILQEWRHGRFELLTCDEHLDELRTATRYPKVRSRISPLVAGILINEIGKVVNHIGRLPQIRRSSDPRDDYLLALAEKGEANFIVSGDKTGVLAMDKFATAKIITARQFADILGL